MLDDTEFTVHERDIFKDPRTGDIDTRGGKKRRVVAVSGRDAIGKHQDVIVYLIGRRTHTCTYAQWKRGPKP